MADKKEIFEKYRKLTDKTDRLTESLEKVHRQHMQCRLGCSFCCMDYSLFPVEFYAIADQLKAEEIRINPEAKSDECIFLVNNACTIYAFRPMICRTHGLPLLYTNEDGEWELSACELNFTEFEEEFHSENAFPQDKFNSRLFMLNKEFIALDDFNRYGEFDLIPLRELGAGNIQL
ncbi:MAG: YkgJ family cysteine cluster protein [Bacteroidota bacterium]